MGALGLDLPKVTDHGSVITAVVVAGATVALVVVTWKYARSTERMARQTRLAADAARDAAQVTLLQALLSVQPLLEVKDVDVAHFPSGDAHPAHAIGTPFRVRVTIVNLGRGTAFRPDARCRVGSSAIEIAEGTTLPIHLDPAEECTVEFQLAASGKNAIVESPKFGLPAAPGSVVVTCHDAFGSLVSSEVGLYWGDGAARFGPSERKYEGGSDLRTRLVALLERILPDPATSGHLE